MATFDELNALNINGHTETKNVGGKELTYLSWPWAWAEVKKRYPDAHYDIWRDSYGLPYVHDPITGYMVSTTVTIDGVTHTMWLPVMDGANNAMKCVPYEYTVKNPKFKYAKKANDGKYYDSYGNEQPEFLTKKVEQASMMDINKTIMRCLVKNLAMFGLGLYIYAGEDLPESEKPEEKPEGKPEEKPTKQTLADKVNAAVDKVQKLPREAAPPEEPKKDVDPVAKYLLAQMGALRQQRGITSAENNKLFKDQMETLIKAKMAPDKKLEEYTMQEAQNLIQAMMKCFNGKSSELIVQ